MQQIQDIPENPKPDLVITGHQWWWEAKYPQSGVLTANEIHIPVGKRILLEVNSADVIHSWWVPALGRKIDMIPGLKNYIWLYADKPREYLGACSEFCGIEHARMRIRVVADTEEDFKKWTESQLEPVITQATPLFDKGKALFEQKTCTNCHGINGTPFSENIGPNLTHFGSRKRFLSDMKPVTRENLKEWLTNPQNVKPGVKMPNFIFNPDEISKYADCGVAMLDAPSEVVEIALNYLGYDANTENTKANEEALELLKQIRPYIKYFDSSQYIDDLANGEICLAVGWSGDVFIAAYEEIEEVWYSIPNEGTVIWFDMMGIPADAKNVDNAHKFIDYILRPEVVAEITNYVWYSNPNLVANTTEGLIDPEILEDPAIYPTEETLLKLFADTADSPQKSRISSRVFNSFKAAQ